MLVCDSGVAVVTFYFSYLITIVMVPTLWSEHFLEEEKTSGSVSFCFQAYFKLTFGLTPFHCTCVSLILVHRWYRKLSNFGVPFVLCVLGLVDL